MNTGARERYTREFKIEAVRRVLIGKEPVKAVADDLGIHVSLMYTWIYRYQEDPVNAFPGTLGPRRSYHKRHSLNPVMKHFSRDRIALLIVLGLIAAAGVCLSVF